MYMKISSFVLAAIFSLALSSAWAQSSARNNAPEQSIQLKDGTIIKGKLAGVSGDRYIIESATLGKTEIKISDLKSISAEESGSTQTKLAPDQAIPGTPSFALPPQMQMMQQQLLSDPEISAMIKEIASDPDVAKIAQDPSLIQSALSMNPQQIQSNPSVQKLLQHPKMQQLMNLVAKKLMPSSTLNPK